MRALVVGRFQPLHKGHAALIKQAQEECGEVAIAIGSTQAKPSLRNPFTAAERRDMVAAVFPQVPVFDVPDLHDPPRWASHCLGITGKVDKVYGNDDATLDLFEMEGLAVVRPGLVHREEYEASAIRALMAEGDRAWMKAVPQPVADLLLKWDAPRRLLQLS
ncbi:MAG TPA: adenylyltransferase/cytidyltransferase family protein [Candidatus Thermoplasmatota archaeon]|nr:adenylyltransferase/cytidyltransferase family protein [Candidatus Thermoplasmatota archaeon]